MFEYAQLGELKDYDRMPEGLARARSTIKECKEKDRSVDSLTPSVLEC